MRTRKRFTLIVLSMIFCVCMLATPAYAESVSQDGLEVTLTTDKTDYTASDDIVAVLKVKNTNDAAVENVSLETLIPDGYKLSDGAAAAKTIESLGAGKTAELTVTYVADNGKTNGEAKASDTDSSTGSSKDSNSDSKGNSGSNSGNTRTASQTGTSAIAQKDVTGKRTGVEALTTGDSMKYILLLAVLVISGLAAVLFVRRKKGKKLLSLVLGITIAGSDLTAVMPLRSYAAENQNKSIKVETQVCVNDTDSAAVTITGNVYYGGSEIVTSDNDEPEGLPMPENPSESDKYYWNNSTVISVTPVDEATNVMSESEVSVKLAERGFVDYPITYNYSITGEYCDETEIEDSSNNKHPMYMTYYMTKSGEMWSIFVIGQSIIANPVSFNLESDLEAEQLISETRELTSYDYAENKFYVTIPYESEVIVKTVKTINAETLNRLTIEEMKKL